MGKAGIDHFDKQQFEAALPVNKTTGKQMWVCAGLVNGEYTYSIPVGGEDSHVIIEIRSSIDKTGLSADTGENSILAYLIWFDKKSGNWRPLGSKVQKYVTRLPGWQDRLTEMLRTLYGWRLKTGNCPKCGLPKGIFKVSKAGENHGRVYAKCMTHNEFRWMDDLEKEAGK